MSEERRDVERNDVERSEVEAPLFEAETVYTWELVRAYCKEMLFKDKRRIALVVVVELFALTACKFCFDIRLNIGVWIMLALCVAYPFYVAWINNRIMRKYWESAKFMQNLRLCYRFYPDFVEQISDVSRRKLRYDQLDRIMEGKQAFYLFISNNQALLLEKTACSAELQEFLRSKI